MRVRLTFLLAALAAPSLAQVPAGPEFRVNTYTTNDQSSARAAIDAAGRFTITWTSQPQLTPGFSIWARRYAPDGAPTGAEFLVPSAPSTGEGLSDVAYGPAGNSLIAWHAS